ncbi:MAG: DUF938 domain-containing protein, partial [Pseudomonadota bacterium]|nr:DUF938 domain-containing protein [Pseudomonadota bacterium]
MPILDSVPFSQACENNKLPILEVLNRHLTDAQTLLEIGGGTGQHAVFFARHFPGLIWQSSDAPSNVEILNLRLASAKITNLPLAISLDVNQEKWNCVCCDA